MKLSVRLALGVALLARTAVAEPPRAREVVIVGEATDSLVRDLKVQLGESRFSARVVAPSTTALHDIAEAEHATAVVRVSPTHHEIEVWLAHWQAGRPLLDMRLRNAPGGDEEALVLQCIEVLRDAADSGLEPKPAPPRAERPRESPKTDKTEAPAATSGLRLELGVAYNVAGSRLHWASLEGAVGVSSPNWFGLVRGGAPWSSAVVTEPAGSAEARSPNFGVSSGASWWSPRWAFRAGPTLGARSLRILGTDSTARVRSQHAWQFEAGLDALLEYRARLPVFIGVRATFVAPQGHLRFLEVERARFGPLVVAAQLGFAFGAEPAPRIAPRVGGHL
jgi:hypothetical protein